MKLERPSCQNSSTDGQNASFWCVDTVECCVIMLKNPSWPEKCRFYFDEINFLAQLLLQVIAVPNQ